VEEVDVLIVGAGLSGIGAAWHLQNRCTDRSYAIVEARDAIGGTWDLFRYPGIRSDSDMFTLGYRFRPWTEAKAIADGPSILRYVRETAHEAGIDRHIRFRHKVVAAHWHSGDARWEVEADTPDGRVRMRAQFLLMCSGYYSYDDAYRPQWPEEARFSGTFVHPQFWPDDLDHTGKRVVVIGSGATAMTLVPELAKTAAHVTMLQRSPTYVVSQPAEDRLANLTRRALGARISYFLTRWRKVGFQMFFYRMTRKRPEKVKKKLLEMVGAALGPDAVAAHFTPRYNPWDQRLCLIPDDDLYDAIRARRASVVTDRIARFTDDGIELQSGERIPADIVVTATGLKLNVLGDVAFDLDGTPVDLGKALIYKGMMIGDVPNLGFVFGYTNASWTLKADLTSEYVCRLLNHMKARGVRVATPRPHADIAEEPFLDFSSGYVQRALDALPKQGNVRPWKLHQNYALDMVTLRYGRIEDGAMAFTNPEPVRQAAA
jgi:monooxygenase